MTNKISIAMTTYNGEKFIERQLKSLNNQTRRPDEVIIFDDASCDNTVEIVEKFIKDNNLYNWKVFKSNTNEGFIKTFNKSIAKTTGDIIFLCDQDDIWIENKIELMSNLMINENILAMSSSFTKIDSNDLDINQKKSLFYSNNQLIRRKIKDEKIEKIDIKEVLAYNISPGCTCAFSSKLREKYLEVSNYESVLPHDWAINIIAACNDGLYFFNKPLIKYRIHSSNTLGLNRKLNISDRIIACEKNLEEKKSIKKILKKINYINDRKDIEDYISNIIFFTSDRVSALKSKKIIEGLKITLKYNFIKLNMLDSLIVDLIVLLKKV